MVEQEPQDTQPQAAPEPQLFAVESLPEKLMRQAQESLDATEERLTELNGGIADHIKQASVMRAERDTLYAYQADLKRILKPRGRGAKNGFEKAVNRDEEAMKREQEAQA